jgi:hypothetical protein
MGCALPRHKCFHILFKSHLVPPVRVPSTSASGFFRGDEEEKKKNCTRLSSTKEFRGAKKLHERHFQPEAFKEAQR